MKFNKLFSLLLGLGIVFYHSNRNLDSDSKICMYPTSTYLEMVPPTVGWSLLHQSTVKQVPHIFPHRPIWSRQILNQFFPLQVILGCSKIKMLIRTQSTLSLRSRSKSRHRMQISPISFHFLVSLYFLHLKWLFSCNIFWLLFPSNHQRFLCPNLLPSEFKPYLSL